MLRAVSGLAGSPDDGAGCASSFGRKGGVDSQGCSIPSAANIAVSIADRYCGYVYILECDSVGSGVVSVCVRSIVKYKCGTIRVTWIEFNIGLAACRKSDFECAGEIDAFADCRNSIECSAWRRYVVRIGNLRPKKCSRHNGERCKFIRGYSPELTFESLTNYCTATKRVHIKIVICFK